MAIVHFTRWLNGIAPGAPVEIEGKTVGGVLGHLFAKNAAARNYVLDEQGCLRKHVCIFADGRRLPQQAALGHAIGKDSTLYVMQALSGG